MSSLKFMNDPDVTPEDAAKVINALAAAGVRGQIAVGASAIVGAAGVSGVINRRVAVGVIGQSNELGVGYKYNSALGAATDSAAYAKCWSRSVDGQTDPIAPAVTSSMSMWPRVVDRLAQRGVKATIVNGGIGSASFARDVCGQTKSWSATTAYYAQRAAGPTGDGGHKGDVIVVSGRIWRCTTGNNKYTHFNDPGGAGLTLYGVGSDSGYTVKQLDYIMVGAANSALLKTGASQPAGLSSSGTPGVTTVTDGDITWTLVSNSGASEYTSFSPFPETFTADFDPFGILARLKTALDAVTNVDEKWVVISNGQSDAGGSVGAQATYLAWYQAALESICDWAIAQGYKVLIGFTCANPTDEAAGNGYRWVTLDSAWAAAVASRANGSTIFAGANLYRSLGLSPSVYPQSGLPYGVHLTDAGLLAGGDAWADALIAAGF